MNDGATASSTVAVKTATAPHVRTATLSGFVAVARERSVEFRLYGSLQNTSGALLHFFDHGVVQTALMGRLYYRTELRERIGATSLTEDDNDAELAVRAYRNGGASALERLEGEFALVLWDRERRELFALRDPMGGYPIYWHHGDALTIGTSLRAVAQSAPDIALDFDYFGELLTLPFCEIDYFEGTPIKGVYRLTSGSMLTARGPERLQVRSYWNWLERIEDPGAQSISEIGARYGELLRSATRERLRGTVAAHLSGGMDSTSIALLAAQACAEKGESVHGLSLIYDKLSDLVVETPYLESALDRPGLIGHRISADAILDYDVFRDAAPHEEPYSGFYRAGTDIAMIDVAVESGCHTILTGLGADEVLDTAPFYMADMLKRGHALKAWGEAAKWARAFNTNPWRLFRPFAITPLVPAWLQPGIKPLLKGGYADWSGQSAMTIAPWVRREFVAQTRIQARIRERVAFSYGAADTVVLSEALGRIRYACGDWVRYNLAAPHGIHMAHPFRDPRVLAFGLGTRMRVRPTPSRQKIVLAEAMKDVLPPMILQRFDKGHFNAVYYAGLARNLSTLEDMVRESQVEKLGLFDADELIRCMKDAALSYRRVEGKIGLDNSLVIAKWLTMLPRWRQFKHAPARVIGDDGSRL